MVICSSFGICIRKCHPHPKCGVFGCRRRRSDAKTGNPHVIIIIINIIIDLLFYVDQNTNIISVMHRDPHCQSWGSNRADDQVWQNRVESWTSGRLLISDQSWLSGNRLIILESALEINSKWFL